MKQCNVIVLLVMMTAVLSGCLVTSVSRVEEHGVQVSPTTLSQIEVGRTTEGWLRATLGEPTSCATVEDQADVKLLRYTYTERKTDTGRVFLLFGGKSHRTSSSTTYFEVTDGVVSRHWTES